jgi:hypothetical protein
MVGHDRSIVDPFQVSVLMQPRASEGPALVCFPYSIA